MPLAKHSDYKKRYIIHSDDAQQLNELVETIKHDPAIELMDVIGPTNAPHTVVAKMPAEKAQSLERDHMHSKNMKIEPDRPLSLDDKENEN